ncbi:MAG: histidine kinase [Eubacteriales bacterium]
MIKEQIDIVKEYIHRNLTVRLKIMLSILIILSTALIIFYMVVTKLFFEAQERKTFDYNTYVVDNIGSSLDKYLDDVDSMALSLANSPIIQNYSIECDSMTTYEKGIAEGNIESIICMQVSSRQDSQISVFIEKNQSSFYNSYYDLTPQYDYRTDGWYQYCDFDIEDNKILILDNEQNYFTREYRTEVVTYVYPIRNFYNLSVIGYVVVDIDKQYFDNFFSVSDMIVINNMLFDELGQLIHQSGDLPEGFNFDLEEVDINGMIQKIDTDNYFILSRKSAVSDWTYVGIINYNEFIGEMKEFDIIFLVILITLIVISVVISYVLSRIISEPIQTLCKSMNEISSNNFDVSISEIYTAEVGVLVERFNYMAIQLKSYDSKIKTFETLTSQNQLKMLQQQINPHFLYNTLQMVVGLAAEQEFKKIIQTSNALGDMMRYNLNMKKTVTLKEEFNQLRNYTTIIMLRHEGRIVINYQLIAECEEYKLSKLLLQPLVENSITHGSKGNREVTSVNVKATLSSEQINILVQDNGVGIPELKLQQLKEMIDSIKKGNLDVLDISTHIGILNICQRLSIQYQDRYEFDIESEEGEGTCINLKIPKIV